MESLGYRSNEITRLCYLFHFFVGLAKSYLGNVGNFARSLRERSQDILRSPLTLLCKLPNLENGMSFSGTFNPRCHFPTQKSGRPSWNKTAYCRLVRLRKRRSDTRRARICRNKSAQLYATSSTLGRSRCGGFLGSRCCTIF